MSQPSQLALRATANGCTLPVRVHPGARRNAITGLHDGALKISLTTPPTDGRANAALIAYLAEQLELPRASIELQSGATSRSKAFHLHGLTPSMVEARVMTLLAK